MDCFHNNLVDGQWRDTRAEYFKSVLRPRRMTMRLHDSGLLNLGVEYPGTPLYCRSPLHSDAFFSDTITASNEHPSLPFISRNSWVKTFECTRHPSPLPALIASAAYPLTDSFPHPHLNHNRYNFVLLNSHLTSPPHLPLSSISSHPTSCCIVTASGASSASRTPISLRRQVGTHVRPGFPSGRMKRRKSASEVDQGCRTCQAATTVLPRHFESFPCVVLEVTLAPLQLTYMGLECIRDTEKKC